MKVLVACEFSGRVRDAFLKRGHDALSCDLRNTEKPGPHFKGDVRTLLNKRWDLIIAHPPCTYLAVSGARWWHEIGNKQQEAIDFVMLFANSKAPRIAIENPISKLSSAWRKPDQIIQPWQFGHQETKATCLWLIGLPKLKTTNDVRRYGLWASVHEASPGPNRERAFADFHRNRSSNG